MTKALKNESCPACGATLLSEPRGAPFRCTRCDWRLISRDEWRELAPRAQGYVFYLQSSWRTSELAGEKNPHAEGTPAWRAFRDGEQRAVLSVLDGEE